MINKFVSNILPYFPKPLVWQFSKRYVAGKDLHDALKVSRELNEKGIEVTIDLLGEFISTLDQARENTETYLHIINEFISEKIIGNFSLKPTSFGLLIDEETCYQNIRSIVQAAADHNNFVRVDMEDSSCTDKEIELFSRLKQEFPENVGLVLQAYMRRTLSDIKTLMQFHSDELPLNIRLCKGIYVEPAEVAFKAYQEVRDKYLEDLDFCFKNGIYVGIATHDKYLVDGAYELIKKYNLASSQYEFQMLYGVTPGLRDSIVEKGHKMRIYVPYGKDWFAYCTRRLKENPRMAGEILKALFVRG